MTASARQPPFKAGLVDRMLVAVARGGAESVVCVTKVDLVGPADRHELDAMLAPYRSLATVVPCSPINGEGIDRVREIVQGRVCVVAGHSGVGKSTLLNAIDPDGERGTGSVRDFDGKGRHTTTASTLRTLPDGTRLIDVPGVRSFGLWAISSEALSLYFDDLAAWVPLCRFRDCAHRDEPDCGVRDAVDRGEVSRARYDAYLRIRASLD